MRLLLSIILMAAVSALAASDPIQTQINDLKDKRTWDTNVTFIASNATTAQIDFSVSTGTKYYEITNLNGNITLQLTNVTANPRADVWVIIRSDGTPRNVSVSTNGITTTTRVRWGGGSTTNGGVSFIVTNQVRANFANLPVGVISADYEYQQP